MDIVKIGKFIAEKRKEKGLTQEQLGVKIGVTSKTISRWENGNYMPDISLLKPLSDELNISLNDLISGEKVKTENYQEKLEENIINTISYKEGTIMNKLSKLFLVIIIILIVSLGGMTYGYLSMKNAYSKSLDIAVNLVKEGMYPDAFYATIEEISDTNVYGIKEIKVKGLEINDIKYRKEFNINVIIDNIGDNFKIKWNDKDIKFEQLKVGQNVAVYNYGQILEENNNLVQVRMIVVLDDTI